MKIKDLINEVYKEAISCGYPGTKERSRAIRTLNGLIEGKVVYDFCPQEKELCELNEIVQPLVPDKDMHYFLEDLEPLNADMIVVRHVLEHSVMPYIMLKLLSKHTKKILLVLPEYTLPMLRYKNHYSVMDESMLKTLCSKSGWNANYIMSQVFQSTGTIENVYILEKKDDR